MQQIKHNFLTRLSLADGSTLDARLLGEARQLRPGFSPDDIRSISFLPTNPKISHGAIIAKKPSQRILWGFIPLLPMVIGGKERQYSRSIGHFVILVDDYASEELKRAEGGAGERNQIFKDAIDQGQGLMIIVNGDTGGVSTQGQKIAVRSESEITFNGRKVAVQIVEVP